MRNILHPSGGLPRHKGRLIAGEKNGTVGNFIHLPESTHRMHGPPFDSAVCALPNLVPNVVPVPPGTTCWREYDRPHDRWPALWRTVWCLWLRNTRRTLSRRHYPSAMPRLQWNRRLLRECKGRRICSIKSTSEVDRQCSIPILRAQVFYLDARGQVAALHTSVSRQPNSDCAWSIARERQPICHITFGPHGLRCFVLR